MAQYVSDSKFSYIECKRIYSTRGSEHLLITLPTVGAGIVVKYKISISKKVPGFESMCYIMISEYDVNHKIALRLNTNNQTPNPTLTNSLESMTDNTREFSHTSESADCKYVLVEIDASYSYNLGCVMKIEEI